MLKPPSFHTTECRKRSARRVAWVDVVTLGPVRQFPLAFISRQLSRADA